MLNEGHGEMQFAQLGYLIRGVWLQALRRREIYVLGILMGLYLAGALIVRLVGLPNAQAARFVTGLGLQLASLLSALWVIVMGARQVPDEIELRTILPVLAKPITRAQFLAGKAVPIFVTGAAAFLIFTLATLAIAPRMPFQRVSVLAEVLLMRIAGLAMLTAIVFWLSVWLPSALAMLAGTAVQFLSGMAINVIAQAGGGRAICRLLASLIPNPGLLDQLQRYVDGGARLGLAGLAGFLCYGALWAMIFGALAEARFRRLRL